MVCHCGLNVLEHGNRALYANSAIVVDTGGNPDASEIPRRLIPTNVFLVSMQRRSVADCLVFRPASAEQACQHFVSPLTVMLNSRSIFRLQQTTFYSNIAPKIRSAACLN